jgi:hypothetical protein
MMIDRELGQEPGMRGKVEGEAEGRIVYRALRWQYSRYCSSGWLGGKSKHSGTAGKRDQDCAQRALSAPS